MAAGYGQDTSCLDGLSTARIVSGRTALAESIYRRLTTPRGTLFGGEEESAYGLDLSGYIGAVGTVVSGAALPAMVESELLKDERISAAVVSVTFSVDLDGTTSFRIQITVTPADSSGNFALTLAASDVTVSIIGGIPS